MLAVDASVVVGSLLARRPLPDDELVAPPLLWSEARSVLHEIAWRGAAPEDDVITAAAGLRAVEIRRIEDDRVGAEAWRIADGLGWAETYDAEYVAVASLLGCRLLTADARLRRRAARLGLVVTPDEL